MKIVSRVFDIKPKLTADDVLEAAKGHLADVVVIGKDDCGNTYVATSLNNEGKVLAWIEKGKQYILDLFD